GDETSVAWARGLSAVLGTLSVGGVYWVAWQLFGSRAALWSAALVAVSPGAIIMGAWVLSEAAFSAVLMLQLGLSVAAWRAQGRWRVAWLGAAAGLAGGAATLVRPSWLLLTPLAAV